MGYLLGYVLAHVFKLDRRDKKAVSIEVGMQNSGLVSLATVHFSPLAAVPGAYSVLFIIFLDLFLPNIGLNVNVIC